jgi:hypothetical protein
MKDSYEHNTDINAINHTVDFGCKHAANDMLEFNKAPMDDIADNRESIIGTVFVCKNDQVSRRVAV